jgi:hypothetical protein
MESEVVHLQILGFWTSPIIRNSKYSIIQRFRNWICFCPWAGGKVIPTLMGIKKTNHIIGMAFTLT